MCELHEEVKKFRKTKYSIAPVFVNRWSPRAISGEELSEDELMPLFEAARWAPSANNSQPWRFIITRRNSESWNKLFDLLAEGNHIWTKNAGALVVIISRKNHEYKEKPSITHSFDAGAAWENLALEGTRRGLVVHAMSGFDYNKAREVLQIPDIFRVESMIAIGKRGKKQDLPEELQEREIPSDRKSLEEIIFEGKFGNPVKW